MYENLFLEDKIDKCCFFIVLDLYRNVLSGSVGSAVWNTN